MLKIAVFGFYGPDHAHILPPESRNHHLSPMSTDAFMRAVWAMEPPESRIGDGTGAPCFVKLTGVAAQPVYVQSLSNQMAPGAALLNAAGYVAIIDAVKILAPKTIRRALRRLVDQHPGVPLIIAAGRQHEPDALSSDEIRAVLGLHPDLPVYPYVPDDPKTVHDLIRRLAASITGPTCAAPPVFAGDAVPALPGEAPDTSPAPERPAPTPPQVHGLASVAITVGDLSRALDFYQGLLGFRLLGTLAPDSTRAQVIARLDTGHGILELFSDTDASATSADPLPAPSRAGLRHITLSVTGLDAVVEQLACAGVAFTDDIAPFGGARLVFLSDPDGTPLALIEGDTRYTQY